MQKKIAVIGAGLAGLTAAHHLKNYANIEIFDKSRGVGGRIATRRATPYAFDHGAQFFTAKSDVFKDFISPMIGAQVIQPWDARFVEIVNGSIILDKQWNDKAPHYVGVPAMNAIPKYLSHDLNIQLNTRVKTIVRQHTQWAIIDAYDNILGEYDWVISAVPSPQALLLLPNTISCYSMITQLKMQACYTLMLGFEEELDLKFDAARIHDETISWISVNNTKPGRGRPYSLLVHSNNNWADKYLEADKDWVINTLCLKLRDIAGVDISKVSHKALHKWSYANTGKHQSKTHYIDPIDSIAICGDWFIQGKVEAAFKSGFETAKQIISIIGDKNDK